MPDRVRAIAASFCPRVPIELPHDYHLRSPPAIALVAAITPALDKDRDGRQSSRQIEPARLAHTGRLWYLVAWDVERKDWRTFRVDRIGRVDAQHCVLSVGAPSPEALTAYMLMAGVDFELLDAGELPPLREVAARLKRGLG